MKLWISNSREHAGTVMRRRQGGVSLDREGTRENVIFGLEGITDALVFVPPGYKSETLHSVPLGFGYELLFMK